MHWTLVGRFLRGLFGNLVAAVLMLCFRRSALRWLTASTGQFLAMLALSLAASFCFDYISEGQPGELVLTGFAVYIMPPFFLMVFGVWLSQRYAAWRLGFAPVVAWLGADVLVASAQCLAQFGGQQGWWSEESVQWVPTLYTFLFLWPLAAVVTLFGRALGWRWWHDGLAALFMFVLFFAWSFGFSDARMWSAVGDEAAAPEEPALLAEDVFYAQPELLAKSLAAVQPGQKGKVEWYFMGVGGAAYQSVFRRETESARALFDTRFGTAGHSMVLINDDDTATSQPLATRTSIERALKTFGEKMNPDEDVLFLFLTSHGSESHEFELSYDPLELEPVTPEWLRDTLAASGIQRRVVVVSACYSGGFIPMLEAPETLVITASDAKHTSFGCADDADYTYFGRAFVDEALRHQHGLVAAFDEAKGTIREREQAEGFAPSNPQIFVGSVMKQELPALEAKLFPPQ